MLLLGFRLKGETTEAINPGLRNAVFECLDDKILRILVSDLDRCCMCIIVLDLYKTGALRIGKANKNTVIYRPVSSIILNCKELFYMHYHQNIMLFGIIIIPLY